MRLASPQEVTATILGCGMVQCEIRREYILKTPRTTEVQDNRFVGVLGGRALWIRYRPVAFVGVGRFCYYMADLSPSGAHKTRSFLAWNNPPKFPLFWKICNETRTYSPNNHAGRLRCITIWCSHTIEPLPLTPSPVIVLTPRGKAKKGKSNLRCIAYLVPPLSRLIWSEKGACN